MSSAASALGNLFDDIRHQLSGGILNWIDIDFGQLSTPGSVFPLEYPCALIRFDNIIWKDIGDSVQLGLVHFTLKLSYQFNNEDYLANPTAANAEMKTFFILLDNIDVAMRNVRGSNYSIVKRFNDCLIETDPEQLRLIYVMEYQANIQSDSGTLIKPGEVDLDYVDIANNNLVLERKRLNVRRVNY